MVSDNPTIRRDPAGSRDIVVGRELDCEGVDKVMLDVIGNLSWVAIEGIFFSFLPLGNFHYSH